MRLTLGPYTTGGQMAAVDMNAIVQSINSLYDVPIVELSISHTNGVDTQGAGITSLVSGSVGAGTSGGNLTLTPSTPNWRTIPVIAGMTQMNVATNIVAADMVSGGNILIHFAYGVLTPGPSGSSGFARTITADYTGGITGGGAVSGGVINTPPEIGDAGTLYGLQSGSRVPIGSPESTELSNNYFTYHIYIPASAATKVYKFKAALTYQ